MKIIYSEKPIEGEKGAYIDPRFFSKVDARATEVMADDKDILDAYKEAEVKVSPITRTVAKRKTKAKESKDKS